MLGIAFFSKVDFSCSDLESIGYELIANCMFLMEAAELGEPPANSYWQGKKHGWEDACKGLAHLLAQDNPRFDRARFLKACGLED